MQAIDVEDMRRFVRERMNLHSTLTNEKVAEIAMQATWDYLAPLIRDGEEYAARISAQAVCDMFRREFGITSDREGDTDNDLWT